MNAALFERRMILVMGKGGVGRSTVAAAIAGQLAAAGKRTLLFETNAVDRFGGFFGKPAVGPDITQLAPNLFAVNTNPAAALEEYGLMVLRWKSVYEMVFENRVTRAFLRAVPGMDDYAVLGKAWYHTTETRTTLRGARPVWDTVVFDMPASGHAMSMLRVPWVIVETVPEGPLTQTGRAVKAVLVDPAQTSVVLVTLAEEMPVNEAIEFEGKLTALGIPPQLLVVNQVFPEHVPGGGPLARVLDTLATAPALASPLAEVTAHAQLARDRHALNAHYLHELTRRAATPLVELPRLFARTLEGPHIADLGKRLTA